MSDPKLDEKMNLTFNLSDVIDRLQPEERHSILLHVGFDSHFIEMAVSMLAMGYTADGWWIGGDWAQRLRDKLAENMRGLQIETIKDLRNQRDQAIANEKRMDEWAWAMWRLRDDLASARKKWPELPAFKSAQWTDRRRAEQLLNADEGAAPAAVNDVDADPAPGDHL